MLLPLRRLPGATFGYFDSGLSPDISTGNGAVFYAVLVWVHTGQQSAVKQAKEAEVGRVK